MSITLNGYQITSRRTMDLTREQKWSLSGYAMGIAGEAGEVADMLKKHTHHGHDLDTVALVQELGDVLWYISAIATELGVDLETVAQGNIDKLKARYPNGFDRQRSINREG